MDRMLPGCRSTRAASAVTTVVRQPHLATLTRHEKHYHAQRKPGTVVELEKARQSGNVCFELPLAGKTLAPQVAASVTVAAVLVKAQTARPSKITHGDPQRMIWETTAYLQTPYPVEKQSLKVHRSARHRAHDSSNKTSVRARCVGRSGVCWVWTDCVAANENCCADQILEHGMVKDLTWHVHSLLFTRDVLRTMAEVHRIQPAVVRGTSLVTAPTPRR